MTKEDVAASSRRVEEVEIALRKIHDSLRSYMSVLDDDPDHRIGDSFVTACEALGVEWNPPGPDRKRKYCVFCEERDKPIRSLRNRPICEECFQAIEAALTLPCREGPHEKEKGIDD